MADYVVDTNVWVKVDAPFAQADEKDRDCIQTCRQWLHNFMNSEDRLIVDIYYQILREYRDNIDASHRLAHAWLNSLQRAPQGKLVGVSIDLDEDGNVMLPFHLHDREDRKFVAVALAHTPTPPIVNASDTDWIQDKTALLGAGLAVQELCPDYIEEKLRK